MNDVVDRLAVEAATTQHRRVGDAPPTSLGPPDNFGTGESAGQGATGVTAWADDEQGKLF